VRSLFLASAFVLIAAPAFAGEAGEWKPISNEDGIKVWQREVPGTSFVEFRGQGDVKTNMKMILAVLHDNTRKTEWMNRCRENRLVRAKKVGNNVLYNRTGSGFPLIDDRDVVVESHLTVMREQRKVRIDVKNVEDKLAPPVDGVVRMPKLVLSWTLEWKDSQTTGVTYQVQADPGGLLPSWIVNLVSKEMPYKTIAALREQVKKPGYDKDLMIVEASYDWSGIE
jgi:hypothetical protein